MVVTEHQDIPPTDTGSASENAVRCVVLSAHGPAPHELTESLRRRGVRISESTDVFSTMAAILALLDSDLDIGPVGLIVVDPTTLIRGEELLRAIERCCPHVARWRYDAKARERLAAWKIEMPTSPPKVVVRNGATLATAQGAPPALRLAGLESELAPEDDGDAQEESLAEGDDHGVLTPEELAMLLSDPVDDDDLQRPLGGGDS